jgi:predicted membrane channel-forming protein YqfA (hemolysin III family)
MISVDRILILIILLWIAAYTVSFGKWTWKRRNRLGAVMVFLVALAAIVLPIYALFIREG